MTLEAVVVALIRHGHDRCGSGFGKYPLGIRHAIHELLPLVDQNYRDTKTKGDGTPSPTLADELADFDRRLEQ